MDAGILQVQGVSQNELSHDDGGTLEIDGLPAVVAKGLDVEQGRVRECGGLGQQPFKVGKKGRIVQRPFRSFLCRAEHGMGAMAGLGHWRVCSPRSTILWRVGNGLVPTSCGGPRNR